MSNWVPTIKLYFNKPVCIDKYKIKYAHVRNGTYTDNWYLISIDYKVINKNCRTKILHQ